MLRRVSDLLALIGLGCDEETKRGDKKMEPELLVYVSTMLLTAAALGVITGLLAAKKGRNAFAWWLFGMLLFLVALPAILILEPKESQWSKRCAHCAEWIRREASRCRYCGERL